MNKCIKITLKSCSELDNYKKVLNNLKYQSWLASNKAMSEYYSFAIENMEYKKINGININEKNRFGKTHRTWVYDKINKIMTMHNSGNIAQTNQFVLNRFNNDKKKGLFKGQVSISNFKQSIPIMVHNTNYKIHQGDKGFKIECSLFNLKYQKENNIKRVTFLIDKLDNNQKATLNKINLGMYKQGSAQIAEDKKGKWYFTISFSFEPPIHQLNKNSILGIDLGISKVATMQIYNTEKQNWEKLSWKACMIDGAELIHFRQKIEARKRQLQIASKVVGEGRTGHGKKTRMKPLESINDKVGKFRDTYNHKVSKYIVDLAVKNDCGIIQMENLSGFSGEQSESFLKNWSYYDLQSKVEYKAKEKGIEVRFINPHYTSKRCSKCGCIHQDNRDCKKNQAKFKCITCGHEENADINAAKNIAMQDIEDIIQQTIKRGIDKVIQ